MAVWDRRELGAETLEGSGGLLDGWGLGAKTLRIFSAWGEGSRRLGSWSCCPPLTALVTAGMSKSLNIIYGATLLPVLRLTSPWSGDSGSGWSWHGSRGKVSVGVRDEAVGDAEGERGETQGVGSKVASARSPWLTLSGFKCLELFRPGCAS